MTSDALIDLLIEKVAGGGNLLLDIGPTADGRIPVIMQQRLLDMGAWLEINGDAIYGSRKWEGARDNQSEGVYFTQNGSDLFVLCTQLPEKAITVSGIKKSGNVTLLGSDIKISAKKSGNGMTIAIPKVSLSENQGKYAWVFKIENVL